MMALKRPNEDVSGPSASKRTRFSIDTLLETPPPAEDLPQEEEVEQVNNITPPPTPSRKCGGSPRGDPLDGVEVRLEGSELWSKFYELGTEMIITKSGRRMFPTVKLSVNNIDSDALYYVFLDVIPVDGKRYRYIYNKSAWLAAGKAEPAPKNRLYLHPDAPFTGEQLMKQVVSFEKAKLTNNEVDRTGHLILNSMHKYQPRIHLVRRPKGRPLDAAKMQLTNEVHRTVVFPETQFMAVTAYQNQLITKLKIEKNPFAKGFRDPSGRSPDYDPEPRQEPQLLLPPLYNQAVIQQALLGQYYLKAAARALPPLAPGLLGQMLLSQLPLPMQRPEPPPKSDGLQI